MIATIDGMTDDAGLWGGKAQPLRALAAAGFRVPEGFCLGTDAFMEYLSNNRIKATFDESMRRPGRTARRIRGGSFPPGLEADLRAAFDALAATSPEGASFIARSSSPMEDGRDFSAAGLFDSIEGIRDAAGLLAAVRACWASLYSDKAIAALLDRPGGHRRADLPEPRMAVVVQAWIPGALSGVCFTCDVKEGRTDRLAVNWVEGPCRGLADGSAPSSMALFSKGGHETVSAPSGEAKGLAEVRASLAEFERIESVLGLPCDIEWTHDGRRLWILQARPVTTLRPPASDLPAWLSEPGARWKAIPYREPFRPLEEEAWLASNQGTQEAGEDMGWDFLREEGRCFRGRAYSRPSGRTGPGRLGIVDRANRAIAAGTDLYHGDALPRILEAQRPIAAALRRRPTPASAAGIMERALEQVRLNARLHWTAVWGMAYAEPWDEGIHDVKRDLPELRERFTPAELFDLLYAPSEASSLRAALARSTALALREPSLSAAFASIASDRLLYLRLPALRGGRALLRILNRALRRWGFSRLETDWRDPFSLPPALAPWSLIGEIRWLLLGRLPHGDPAAALRSRQRKLERSFLASLPAGRRRFAQRCLRKARAAFTTREGHAFHFDEAKFGFFIAAARHAGAALAATGMIGRWDEVFFLREAEIEAALAGRARPDEAVIAARKAEWEEGRRLRFPGEDAAEAAQRASGGAAAAAPRVGAAGPLPPLGELSSSLAGSATMDGLVRGRAWFPDEGAPEGGDPLILILRDERSVLLAPYLSRVAGVVYDSGSPFSHLAISAREWGIPALYGTGSACDCLSNGQAIALDGKEGKLRYRS